MKLPAKIHYGVIVMMDLAKYRGKTLVCANLVARREKISFQFVANLLSRLKRAGLLESKKGGVGGYILKRAPSEITVKDVINAIDGSISISPGIAECDSCPFDKGLRSFWQEIEANIENILESTTIAHLLEKVERGGAK
jgi:Rrf2 family protein